MKLDLTGKDKPALTNFIGWIMMTMSSAGLMWWTKDYILGVWLLVAYGLYALIYLTEKVEDLNPKEENNEEPQQGAE